jgi:hypothetical protein
LTALAAKEVKRTHLFAVAHHAVVVVNVSSH